MRGKLLFISIGIISVVAIFLISTKNTKETLLSGIVLNDNCTESEKILAQLSDDFVLNISGRPSENKIVFNTSRSYFPDKTTRAGNENYATVLLHNSQTARGWLDFVIGDLDSLSVLAYGGYYKDLSLILTEEQLRLLEPYILFIDHSVLVELKDTIAGGKYGTLDQIPASTKPELMDAPVPVFINLMECTYIKALYPELKDPVVFAVAANDAKDNLIWEFVMFLLNSK